MPSFKLKSSNFKVQSSKIVTLRVFKSGASVQTVVCSASIKHWYRYALASAFQPTLCSAPGNRKWMLRKARHDCSCVCPGCLPRLVYLAGADRAGLSATRRPRRPDFLWRLQQICFYLSRLLLRLVHLLRQRPFTWSFSALPAEQVVFLYHQ